MTQSDFAKSKSLPLSCFAYWRTVYLRAQRNDDFSSPPAFIPVSPPVSMGTGMIELIFPSGVRAIFYKADAGLIKDLIR